MESKYKKALEEILMNLRCIDTTGNNQVDSYVDYSISIIQGVMKENENKTALEVSVQEQFNTNFSSITGEKNSSICPKCWVKKQPYNCGYDKCPGYKLLINEIVTVEK
ncbi:hypothetical protein FDC58_17015 [Clostridium botulinum]|uniref:hypothetical protein n=1 Tax=unclassified Clostridium TaxID=2614128 RepID=UPI0013CC6ED0|nr:MULTISPECIES: hypothetical protein [unclassified Clostridium]MBY7009426.1 hypothetical protein [Clostridium botulinum]NFH73849.1 hypothetical protein [Clostridium botulinum]NFI02102.1 hypothetical protein [Clostridium botulinum]NFI64295.1 hypothetical protein [Clostridium botulinum]NFJ45088.1 hypothetical protein [Clostridium botulinum]